MLFWPVPYSALVQNTAHANPALLRQPWTSVKERVAAASENSDRRTVMHGTLVIDCHAESQRVVRLIG